MNYKSICILLLLAATALAAIDKDIMPNVPVNLTSSRVMQAHSDRRYTRDILIPPVPIENCTMCLYSPLVT